MKLLWKFNLIFLAMFAVGLVLSGVVSYRLLHQSARDDVIKEAGLMVQTASATRQYTSEQIKPLVTQKERRDKVFHPQIVPAFAAMENFKYLREKYPDFTYKEATLNPTNLRDRAADWEADIVNEFRNHSDKKELIGERDTPTGRALYLARPIKAEASCMECHSTAAKAPAPLLATYGPEHGFGWIVDDIVGAQIVSAPMAVSVSMADAAFRTQMLSIAGILVITLVVLDLALLFAVIRPVTRLSQMADRISYGDLDIPELPVKGSDEIERLKKSFNRMQCSLIKAVEMLERP
jgi:protein-histidine pros-kinase